MEVHNYTFFMTGEAYNDGYDRIFRKAGKNGKKVHAPRRRRKVQKTGSQGRKQGSRGVDRSEEVRQEENGKDGG